MSLAAGLLGGHVGGRPQDPPVGRHRDLARLALRQAEIDDVRLARAIEQDIGWLQVAVDDAALVRRGAARRPPCAQLRRLARARLSTGQPVGQRNAVDIIADDIEPTVVAAHFVDADDVRVPQLRGRASLAQELFALFGIQAPTAGDLDGHHPVKLRVARLPDRSKGAGPQTLLKSKVSDRLWLRCARGLRGMAGERFVAGQSEMAATGGAIDAGQWIDIHHLNRVPAMRTTDVHRWLFPARAGNG